MHRGMKTNLFHKSLEFGAVTKTFYIFVLIAKTEEGAIKVLRNCVQRIWWSCFALMTPLMIF